MGTCLREWHDIAGRKTHDWFLGHCRILHILSQLGFLLTYGLKAERVQARGAGFFEGAGVEVLSLAGTWSIVYR
jgi:hypothetical protein